jgi:hypothetical protein
MRPTIVKTALHTHQGKKPLVFNNRLVNSLTKDVRPTPIAILDGDPVLPDDMNAKDYCIGVLATTNTTHLFKRGDLRAV